MTQETPREAMYCYIGIGSNLDNPLEHVKRALKELKQLSNCSWVGASSLYKSEPVGPPGQEKYINAVACVSSTQDPEHMLDQLQAIENRHHRVRIERWGSRTLDLDILLIADLNISTPRLTVPHPFIEERNFVLVPLLELNSNLLINGRAIRDVLTQCPAGDLQILQKLI